MIFFSYNFIRLGLTRAKALQTVSRFPRETRRRYAASKSNAFTLTLGTLDHLSLLIYLKGYPKLKCTFFRIRIFMIQIKDFNIRVVKIRMEGDKIS